VNAAKVFAVATGERDAETFWAQVHTSLAARRLRLVFVADAIPPELERIVDFLNEQMEVTEVLAIEVKQFVDEAGAHQTIVPRVLGQTQAARQAKGQVPRRDWTRESVLAELEVKRGTAERAVATRTFDWAARSARAAKSARDAEAALARRHLPSDASALARFAPVERQRRRARCSPRDWALRVPRAHGAKRLPFARNRLVLPVATSRRRRAPPSLAR
jgi:hypothetical protein